MEEFLVNACADAQGAAVQEIVFPLTFGNSKNWSRSLPKVCVQYVQNKGLPLSVSQFSGAMVLFATLLCIWLLNVSKL